MVDTILPNFFVDEDGDSCEQFGETNMGMAGAAGLASSDDIFSILEALEGHFSPSLSTDSPLDDASIFASSKENKDQPSCNTPTTLPTTATTILVSQKFSSTSSSAAALQGYETDQTDLELEMEPEEVPSSSPKSKRQKVNNSANNNYSDQEAAAGGANSDGQQKNMSHINVERNRRKQMNEHLTVLRGLMPCFYVKRGDQASIIGGVVDYISELQQVLQSLEAKKQRKVYSDIVLSPRVVSSPRPSPLSPRKPPLSPRPNLPISPRTPQSSTSPYKPRLLQQVQASTNNSAGYNLQSPTVATSAPSPCSSSTTSSINDTVNELVANSKSAIADVEVKFCGPNLLVKTHSPRIPGQAMKIISTLEELSLEILHADISAIDDTTMVFSFTIKIGIECQLSADELAQQIQLTFC